MYFLVSLFSVYFYLFLYLVEHYLSSTCHCPPKSHKVIKRKQQGISLPRSGECSSVAEEEERRLVMTGSVCLDKFIVDNDRLSASTKK